MFQSLKKESQTLCLYCGFCCDGSLFGLARIGKAEEVESLEGKWFVIRREDGKNWFLQPCPHYRNEKCRIYDDNSKPLICSDYKCILLKKCLNGDMSWLTAGKIIHNTKKVMADVKSSLRSSGRDDAPPSLNERLAKLGIMAESEEFRQNNGDLLLKVNELTSLLECYFKGKKSDESGRFR